MKSGLSSFTLDPPDLKQLAYNVLSMFRDLEVLSPSRSSQAKKIAFINTANRAWSVVETRFLMPHLQGFEVREFYFSPGAKPFKAERTWLDEQIIQCDSHTQLLTQLQAFSPSTIYLRVSPHTRSEYLISVCRVLFPEAALVIEPYDMSCLFDSAVLGYQSAQDPAYVQALQGCAVALHYADALVVKMGGERFDKMPKPRPEIFIPMFPTSAYADDTVKQPLPAELAPLLNNQTKRKVLYAGSASARELVSGIGSVDGANLIRYFDHVIQDEVFSLTIVNGAHFSADEDSSPKFSGLMQRYQAAAPKQPAANYLRALPLDQLACLAINFDLGICCAHYAEDRVVEVTKVSVPNRMTTYLNAELPVIIDDRFEFAATLIESFNAGKKVPAGNFEVFMDTLKQINLIQAKDGVRRLKQHLLEENNKNLASLLLTFR